MSSRDTSPVVGIDLGTTFSCAAVVRGDHVEIIPSESDKHVLPSYVHFKSNGERIVGDEAKENCFRYYSNIIYGVKRFIGQTYNDLKQPTKFPYTIENKDGRPVISLEVNRVLQTFAPEEVSALVLAKIKERAEVYLKTSVSRAVITVPAHFNNAQRQATKNAGRIAGLEVLQIINEPTAAALAYELSNKYQRSKSNVLIYDFGGGTFDVSIVAIENEIIEVLATNGEEYLGGEDIDKRLTDFCIKEFEQEHGVCISEDNRILRRIQQQCENAKKILSDQQNFLIEIDLLDGLRDFKSSITRSKFNELNKDLFHKTLSCLEKTLQDANLTKSDIQEIVLVGGSSRIPYVRKMVREYFNNKDLNASLNPDEAIAIGAARQGAILNGNSSEKITVLLHDVSSLSLGIKAKEGKMSVIIPRNTRIPVSRSRDYKTSKDYQSAIDIPVYEGEGYLAEANRHLGKFCLTGLTPLPKGECIVNVTFEINSDGILNVTAKDHHTQNVSYFTTQFAKGKLTEEEINQMVEDAAKFKLEDERRKEGIRARNSLENYCFELMNTLTMVEIGVTERKVLEDYCKDVQDWMAQSVNLTIEDINKKKNDLLKLVTVFLN